MKTFFSAIFIVMILSFLFFQKTFAASGPDSNFVCGLTISLPASDQIGGIYIPSKTPNSYFRILVIFAQFPDDGWNTSWTEWSKGSAPTYMNSFVDSTTTEMSNIGNVTQYFREMSLGTFTVIGKSYSVIAPHTRQWYDNNNEGRSYINQDVIQELNQTVSFTSYDNWHLVNDYNSINTPDGYIDMICVIWRSIHQDGLIFNLDGDFNFSGEASFGYGSSFTVDNGAETVSEDYPGSGLTVPTGYNGHDYVQKVTIHEMGHYLLGGNEFHAAEAIWAMMWGNGRRSNCANSYERNRLGWITPTEITSGTSSPISLSDYVTTGQAIRVDIPNTNPQEYFLLENHQRISVFDIPDNNYPEKGLFVLHQFGSVPNSLSPSFISANGKWAWAFDHYSPNPYGSGQIPVFKRGAASISGYYDSDLIPTIGGASDYIWAYVDSVTGQDVDIPLVIGDGKDAFALNQTVLGPFDNPPALKSNSDTTQIAVEEIGQTSGAVDVNVFFGNQAIALSSADLNQSLNNNATENNNQRKLIADASGNYHEVFNSGGEIFYRKSTDGGYNWAETVRLSDGSGNNSSACLSSSGTNILAVWQQSSGSTYSVISSHSTDGGVTLSSPSAIISGLTVNPNPVITYAFNNFNLVYCSSSGLENSTSGNNGSTWSSPSTLPGTSGTSANPGITTNSAGWLFLSFDDGQYIYIPTIIQVPDGLHTAALFQITAVWIIIP